MQKFPNAPDGLITVYKIKEPDTGKTIYAGTTKKEPSKIWEVLRPETFKESNPPLYAQLSWYKNHACPATVEIVLRIESQKLALNVLGDILKEIGGKVGGRYSCHHENASRYGIREMVAYLNMYNGSTQHTTKQIGLAWGLSRSATQRVINLAVKSGIITSETKCSAHKSPYTAEGMRFKKIRTLTLRKPANEHPAPESEVSRKDDDVPW